MRFHTTSDTLEMRNKFRGLHKINEYRIYNDFKDMDVWDSLKAESAEEPHDKVSTLRSLLEYAILDWFSQPEIYAGYQDHGTIYLLQGSGGGGSIPTNLVKHLPVVAKGYSGQTRLLGPIHLSRPDQSNPYLVV